MTHGITLRDLERLRSINGQLRVDTHANMRKIQGLNQGYDELQKQFKEVETLTADSAEKNKQLELLREEAETPEYDEFSDEIHHTRQQA